MQLLNRVLQHLLVLLALIQATTLTLALEVEVVIITQSQDIQAQICQITRQATQEAQGRTALHRGQEKQAHFLQSQLS